MAAVERELQQDGSDACSAIAVGENTIDLRNPPNYSKPPTDGFEWFFDEVEDNSDEVDTHGDDTGAINLIMATP